jgi:hypothetical protein
MTSVTRSPARCALVSAVAAVVLMGAAGCDHGDDIGSNGKGGGGGPSSSHGEDSSPVTTMTTMHFAGKKLDAAHRERVKSGVNDAIDPWFDGAFLGDFPRSDWAAAFTGFTKGAAADAEGRDLELLSNASIADQIDSATAIRRRVRLNVFAAQGHPRGATAHFVLEFETKGEVAGSTSVRGDLYLFKEQGQWRIFGYDVDQGQSL